MLIVTVNQPRRRSRRDNSQPRKGNTPATVLEISTHIVLRKLRATEGTRLVQGHLAAQSQSWRMPPWDLSPRSWDRGHLGLPMPPPAGRLPACSAPVQPDAFWICIALVVKRVLCSAIDSDSPGAVWNEVWAVVVKSAKCGALLNKSHTDDHAGTGLAGNLPIPLLRGTW